MGLAKILLLAAVVSGSRPDRRRTVGDGEPCADDLECDNFACAREFATVDSEKVCCFSGDYSWGSLSLGNVCTWQEQGADCLDNRDDLCVSNVCVGGVCLAEPVANGEACDSNPDCINYKCGRVSASFAETDMICCPSDTVFYVNFFGDVCGEQDDGKPCAGNDMICASGSCVGGFCGAGNVTDEGEPGNITQEKEPIDSDSTIDCIESTDQILAAELDADSDELRTYVLCPDRKYPIGFFNFTSYDYENGMAALEVFKSNIHILCGEDGAVSNNCIFEGGTSHVEVFYTTDGDAVLDNVLISGITFEGAEDYNVAFFARGEVSFRDCKFTSNRNTGILDIIGGTFEGDLTVNIDECVFESNVASFFEEEDFATALIYLGGQTLNINNTLIQDNTITIPEGNVVPDNWMTSMILVFGKSKLTIDQSCILGNGAYAAIYSEEETLEFEGTSNYATGASSCNGMLESSDCLDFELEQCPIEGVSVPSGGGGQTLNPPPPTATPAASPQVEGQRTQGACSPDVPLESVTCSPTTKPPTLDGDLGDWSGIQGLETPITGALDDMPYQAGPLRIRCVYDDTHIYFAFEVPGKYRFDPEDNRKCAAISTMMKIASDATFYNMGGCPNAMSGCDAIPSECDSYTVDIGGHWMLSTTEMGTAYPINVADGSGDDPVANKKDGVAANPYCRIDDAGPNAGNEWAAAWRHTSPPVTTESTTGKYTFEMSRLLTTKSPETDTQLKAGETYGFGVAFWDPYEYESGWSGPGHFITGCSRDWINLVLDDMTNKDPVVINNGEDEDPVVINNGEDEDPVVINNGEDTVIPCSLCPQGTVLENPNFIVQTELVGGPKNMTCREGETAARSLAADSEVCPTLKEQAENSGCICKAIQSVLGENDFSSGTRALGTGIFAAFGSVAAAMIQLN